jgi:phage terminase large subunit-like protein
VASLDSSTQPAEITDEWRALLAHLPGYDSIASADPGDWFDGDAAQTAVDFFHECLVYIEGEKAGEPFILELWQQAIIVAIFGWKREDGTRRYREAFVYVPRKNGKTPLAAGMVLLMMFTDHEPGAQIYSAAAEREQAALVFRHAAGMILREPELEARSKIYKAFRSIEFAEENTVYKALSADADTKHGLNVHAAVIDELHAHPNRDLVDVLVTGTGSRRQPLIVYITTADYDRPSICNEKHDYACKVRDGLIRNHAFLPVVYEATADDDWTSPDTWAKANPNLNVSVRMEYLENECAKAKDQPTYENTFKRLHLNMKTQQDVRWLSMAAWDASDGTFNLDDMRGKPCFAAMDLASTTDTATFVMLFPDGDNYNLWLDVWIPADRAKEREDRDRVPYMTWREMGHLKTTPGNVIDYEFIKRDIAAHKAKFDIKVVGYDPWNATQIALQLKDNDGMNMLEFRQGYQSMNEPMKVFEKLVIEKRIRHNGNPVLRWMASNVAAKIDPAGNIKPDKAKSTGRIDGIVSAIMATGLAISNTDGGTSIYESRGFLTL